MREITNQNSMNFLKVDAAKKEAQQSKQQQQQTEETQAPAKGTSDLSLSPEALGGYSQVMAASGKINTNHMDNLETDMKVFLDNPKAVQKAVDFFEIAYKQLEEKGEEDAYQKAAILTSAFKDDFLSAS